MIEEPLLEEFEEFAEEEEEEEWSESIMNNI